MTRLRAMSYNVRYASETDHHDVWDSRRDGVVSLVRFHRPDVIGFQEPLPEQRRNLEERLPSYEFVGRGRRADGGGEACPIAVESDRWRITESETFWLSETPADPSTGWNASHPRIATWARVAPAADASSEGASSGEASATAEGTDDAAFLLCNTHFDHVSNRARRESARLLRERISDIAGEEPIVLLGDLNCTPGSEPHRILTEGPLCDAAAVADLRHGPRTSLTDFAELIAERRIDHVFCSPGIDVDAFATLADRDDRGRFPSDHLPAFARLRL